MQVIMTKCNVCGRVKGEANKWIQVSVIDHDESDPVIALHRPVSGGMHYIEGAASEDICSDACLLKRVGEIVAKIRAAEERDPDYLRCPTQAY